MVNLKLSHLADDVELSNEGSFGIWTAGELKSEIKKFDFEKTFKWHTVKRKKWVPCARSMVEGYIESQADEMYEDWEERAMDYASDVLIQNIQTLLDEAFTDGVTTYWEWDKPVEIDVLPEV